MRIEAPKSVPAHLIRVGDLLVDSTNTVRVIDVKRVTGSGGETLLEITVHPIGRMVRDKTQDVTYVFEFERRLTRVASSIELLLAGIAPPC